ncbi:MAG TPA: GntR family transcriptional regulator [Xanthobacteraceae bacterium]
MAPSKSAAFDLRQIAHLDTRAATPLYAQLAERFAAKILSAQAELAGKQLPSENTCVAHFKVSRPTIRQAMTQLLSQGLIERGRGRGTFVAFPNVAHDLGRTFESEFRPNNRRVQFQLIDRALVKPSTKVCQALGLERSDEVEHIRRLRFSEGELYGMEERFLPARYSDRVTAKLLATATGTSLARHILKGESGRIAFVLRAIAADAETASLLGVKKGTPLLSSEHTYFSSAGAHLLHGTVLFLPNQYEFRFQAPVMADL